MKLKSAQVRPLQSKKKKKVKTYEISIQGISGEYSEIIDIPREFLDQFVAQRQIPLHLKIRYRDIKQTGQIQ